MAIKQMTKQGEDFYPKTTTSAVIDEATGKTLDTILSEIGGGSGSVLLELEFEGNSSMEPHVLDALMEGLDYNKTVITFLGKIWEPYLDLNAHKIVLTCLRKQPDDDYIVRETYTVDIETRDVDWKEEKAEREEIKVIEVPGQWLDGEEHSIGMTYEEYLSYPSVIFYFPSNNGAYVRFEKVAVADRNGNFTDIYATTQIGENEVSVCLEVTYGEGEDGENAVIKAIQDFKMLPRFIKSVSETNYKFLNSQGEWLECILKGEYDRKIAELESRLSALEGN